MRNFEIKSFKVKGKYQRIEVKIDKKIGMIIWLPLKNFISKKVKEEILNVSPDLKVNSILYDLISFLNGK